MKRKMYALPLLLLGVLAMVHWGCDKDPEEICESFDAQCGSEALATTCCTDDQCYYVYNGKEYPDTDEGMEDLIEDMCGGNTTTASVIEIQSNLKAQTIKLMAEVRAENICR